MVESGEPCGLVESNVWNMSGLMWSMTLISNFLFRGVVLHMNEL